MFLRQFFEGNFLELAPRMTSCSARRSFIVLYSLLLNVSNVAYHNSVASSLLAHHDAAKEQRDVLLKPSTLQRQGLREKMSRFAD